MSKFVEDSIAKAGLLPILEAHRAGDMATVTASIGSWCSADLLILGAVADAIRAEDVGETVYVRERAREDSPSSPAIKWISPMEGTTELDLLRAVAVARIQASKGARIGVDWSQCGMELAQVALGFGASDLRGPITRKSGLPIYEDEKKKIKGKGMVELRSIRKREIELLVMHAGRIAEFVDDVPRRDTVNNEGVARV